MAPSCDPTGTSLGIHVTLATERRASTVPSSQRRGLCVADLRGFSEWILAAAGCCRLIRPQRRRQPEDYASKSGTSGAATWP
jgi:hypothetical protein